MNLNKLNELISLCVELTNEDVSYKVGLATSSNKMTIFKIINGTLQISRQENLSDEGINNLIDWVYAEEAKEAM